MQIQLELPDNRTYLPMDTIRGSTLIGGVDGTLRGSPVLVPGVKGHALKFNGENQWVDLGIIP